MSSLTDLIDQDLIKAIKSHDLEKATILRTVKAQLQNAAIQTRKELSDEQVVDTLQKEAKKRRESIDIYAKSGRQDLKAKEELELKLLETYLPSQMDDEAIVKIIETAIHEIGASDMSCMGKVMSRVNAQVKGRADGSRVAGLVKNRLSSQ